MSRVLGGAAVGYAEVHRASGPGGGREETGGAGGVGGAGGKLHTQYHVSQAGSDHAA